MAGERLNSEKKIENKSKNNLLKSQKFNLLHFFYFLKQSDPNKEELEYKKWIILWDLNNKDYYHISSDIRKNKINLNDVIDVIRKSNKIRNIFDESNIIELIKGI